MAEYPICINGEKKGRLWVQRQGLYTVFTARAEGSEPLALWVCGGERRALLGRMLPRNGGLFLSRKMTRNDMRGFPPVIEYAGDAQTDTSPVSRPETQRKQIPARSPAERVRAGEEEERSGVQFSPQGGNGTARVSSDDGNGTVRVSSDVVWYKIGGGVLLCPEEGLIALPAALRNKNAVKPHIRVINGREYLVFRR